jgi:hypothetical protein
MGFVGLQEFTGRCNDLWWLFHGDEDKEETDKVCELFVELSSRIALMPDERRDFILPVQILFNLSK